MLLLYNEHNYIVHQVWDSLHTKCVHIKRKVQISCSAMNILKGRKSCKVCECILIIKYPKLIATYVQFLKKVFEFTIIFNKFIQ